MTLKEEKEIFESTRPQYDGGILTFEGVDGFDVYNCSIPFVYGEKTYIYGRVERRNEWAMSQVMLFENVGYDRWKLVSGALNYQLEDPFVAKVGGQFVLGGTHVQYNMGKVDKFYGYFYKGDNIENLHYFTTGPVYMKDIRLIQLSDGKIGVFSRPRGTEILEKYGSESAIGFTIINGLNELSDEVVQNAPLLGGLFAEKEWGGCNQCYVLESGNVGVIGHQCYKDGEKQVYINIAFELDVITREVKNKKIIATKSCFPATTQKIDALSDCAFASGIVPENDGKYHLYSGLGDVCEGRIVINNPFSEKIKF